MTWSETANVEITRQDREILECLRDGWLKAEMPLYGGLSYQHVLNLLDKLDIDATCIEETLNVWDSKIKEMRENGQIT